MQYHHMALVDHHKVPKFGLDMQSIRPTLTKAPPSLPASHLGKYDALVQASTLA